MATPSKLRNFCDEYAARLRSRVAKSPLQKKAAWVPTGITPPEVSGDQYKTDHIKFLKVDGLLEK